MAERQLNVFNKVSQFDSQSLGDSKESFHTSGLFAPFDFSNVDRMEIRLLGKLFLRHWDSLAVQAHRFSDNLPMT